ncbi:hypothetical protein BC834DRAFT_967487 [Gloeopeniophorella convolvens]|nr:hypothetical protein BC834DRAFT_967487 [Gloeopeniophorella convolvens]
MSLLALPSDILILLLSHLAVADLAALSQTCHTLSTLVNRHGWSTALHTLHRPSKSLAKSVPLWSPLEQVKYHTLSDRAWDTKRFVARPLSRPWRGKLQPLLAINESRLFVAAGHTLYSNDITSIASVPDGGSDRTLFVGFDHGELQRIYVPACAPGDQDVPIEPHYRTPFHYHNAELIEALSVSGDSLLSLSSSGKAGLLDLSPRALSAATSAPPHMIDLDTRAWSALLCTSASTPYAAFGTSSDTPLTVHALTRSAGALSPTPLAVLRASADHDPCDAERPTAVYGIASAPPASPWGASDQILVSGWFDGFVRVHDLRAASRAPTLSFADPWSFEPIYAVACGGGAGAHIAAGSARHSVVAFWDVRAPERGWSVHAPGNDVSPVYSVVLESSRLFGATQSRPFVYDFGPAVQPETYPSLPRARGDDGLPYKKGWDRIGFYVTKYDHPSPQLGDH